MRQYRYLDVVENRQTREDVGALERPPHPELADGVGEAQ